MKKYVAYSMNDGIDFGELFEAEDRETALETVLEEDCNMGVRLVEDNTEKPCIVITVSNGLIQTIDKKDLNIDIELRDYDVDGFSENVEEDANGKKFVRRIW